MLRQIIESLDAKNFGYRRDNPGGDWLKYKQEDAAESLETRPRMRGMTGSTTATMGLFSPMKLPSGFVHNIIGARNENRREGDHQYDRLLAAVNERGFDNKDSPVLIMVNHLGEGYLWEGNTRAAVAYETGVRTLYAEVRWWNGGEAVDGPFSPKKILSLASSD